MLLILLLKKKKKVTALLMIPGKSPSNDILLQEFDLQMFVGNKRDSGLFLSLPHRRHTTRAITLLSLSITLLWRKTLAPPKL